MTTPATPAAARPQADKERKVKFEFGPGSVVPAPQTVTAVLSAVANAHHDPFPSKLSVRHGEFSGEYVPLGDAWYYAQTVREEFADRLKAAAAEAAQLRAEVADYKRRLDEVDEDAAIENQWLGNALYEIAELVGVGWPDETNYNREGVKSAISGLIAERDQLRAALGQARALIEKIDAVFDSPEYHNVWLFNQI